VASMLRGGAAWLGITRKLLGPGVAWQRGRVAWLRILRDSAWRGVARAAGFCAIGVAWTAWRGCGFCAILRGMGHAAWLSRGVAWALPCTGVAVGVGISTGRLWVWPWAWARP
jgi:hypothetical protein